MQTIEGILPLKIHAREGASDLDRFSRLLLPSLDRFFSPKDRLKLSLVVPVADLRAVNAHIQKLGRENIGVVCEDDILPKFEGAVWMVQAADPETWRGEDHFVGILSCS